MDPNQNPNPDQPQDDQPVAPQPGQTVDPTRPAQPQETDFDPSQAQVPVPGQSVVPPAVAGSIPGNTVQPGVEGPAVVQDNPVVAQSPVYPDPSAEQTQQFPAPHTQSVPQDPPQPEQQYPAPQQAPPAQASPAVPPPEQVQPMSQQVMPTPVPQSYPQEPMAPVHKGPSKKIIIIMVFVAMFLLGGAVLFLAMSGGSNSTNGDLEEQLKQDNTTMWSAIEQSYNDTGELLILTPEAVAEFASTYLPSNFADPRTEAPYILVTAKPNVGEIRYVLGARCVVGDIEQTTEIDKYGVSILLPDASFYCLDNQ